MRNSQMVLVACTIEAGAFSGKHVIRLKVSDSGREFAGIVPFHYCRRTEDTKLGANRPAPEPLLRVSLRHFSSAMVATKPRSNCRAVMSFG